MASKSDIFRSWKALEIDHLNFTDEEHIDALLDELRDGLFLDDFVHLGGDEVDTACWTQVARVKAWLDAVHDGGLDGLRPSRLQRV